MNPTDRFDDQITEHLRTEAPREAPARLLDATMSRIADTQRVLPKYLELIMLDLKKSGLVKSARGPAGPAP